jgi:GTPase SAR1 family protein
MYSVEDRFTFENLQEWIENAHDSIDDVDGFVWALVGNKSDLPLEIEHDTILARQEQLNTRLSFFTSAKTGDNVTATFERIIEAIHAKKQGERSVPDRSLHNPVKIKSTTRGNTTSQSTAKGGCSCH